jgi:hypothetical protein
MTQGKIIMLGYDEIIAEPANTASCSYCLRANEVEALLALLEYQNWATRWFSTSGSPIDQDSIDAFTDGIRATLMAECQNDIVLTRIDGDGNWQISTDGGVTWVDAPGQDPRLATPISPPVAGADGDTKRCEAANSIVSYFKELAQNIHDAKESGASLSAFTAIITGLLLILGLISGGWLLVVLGALIPLLWHGVDLATWDAAINDDMWQKFICAIYPFINADASVTDYMGMVNAVDAQLDDTVARATWVQYMKIMGDHGLTNAARNGYGGDLECTCSTCDIDRWSIVMYNGNTVGTEVSRDSNSITVSSTVHPDFGFPVAMIHTDADDFGCGVLDLVHVSGDTISAYWRVDVPNPRWPDTSTSGPVTDYPHTDPYNTIYVHSTSAFTVQIKLQ